MYLEIFLADIRGISRFLGNFAGFRGNTWNSRVRDRAKYQKPCYSNQENYMYIYLSLQLLIGFYSNWLPVYDMMLFIDNA